LSLLPNPAHLEAVNPVSMGKTRSQLQVMQDGAFSPYDKNKPFGSSALNIQLHGDAAITGQGIVQECLMMTGLPHFDIGGTIHMVVNNQLGSTTPANRSRRSEYCTDLAKSIGAPVFHVNGDDPEVRSRISDAKFELNNPF
jgi:probable 2-oxoglutarate dehydrogenase E1 component DHKTD1